MNASSFNRWLFALRNYLHQCPELALEEFRTTQKIKEVLCSLGYSPFTLPNMKTGVIANLVGKDKGPVLALRADIDALPIEEKTKNPFKSKNLGRMHACGHDANTTIMLGVAKKLIDTGVAKNIKGSIKFIFQPAEEILTGAQEMIKNGALKDPEVNAIMAVHLYNELEEGKFGFYPNYSHASVDNFHLSIKGVGAHGAHPHKGIDPIVAGCNFTANIQNIICKELNPLEPIVISVCQFTSGSAYNVIPELAEIKGTIRCFSENTRKLCANRMTEIIDGIQKAFKVKIDFKLFHLAPPCFNHQSVTAIVSEAASELVGVENVVELEKQTGGEDFAYYTQIVPGSLWRIGCCNAKMGYINPIHSPYFDFRNKILPKAVSLVFNFVKKYFS